MRTEARWDLTDFIESFYTRSQLHSALGYVSLAQFMAQMLLPSQ